MQRWRGLEDIPEDWGRSVVTIGSYDVSTADTS